MNRRITDKEINQIVEKLNDNCAAIVLICLEAAMRTREIATLNRDTDIDFENKRARLRNPKFRKPQSVYLSDKAIELIKNITPLENGDLLPTNESTVAEAFRRATKSLGINDISFLDIRREAIHRLSRIMTLEELAETTGYEVGEYKNDYHLRKYYE